MLNLASSFRLRNKLKERIATFLSAIEDAEFSKNAGTEENTNPFDGKTLTDTIGEVSILMDFLRELNFKIEKANAVNRGSLIYLETLKAKIAFYEKIAQRCRRGKTYEFEFNEEGERIKVAKEPLVDQGSITTVLTSCKKERDNLEEEISAVNFSAIVDFDPETILSRL